MILKMCGNGLNVNNLPKILGLCLPFLAIYATTFFITQFKHLFFVFAKILF